MNLFSLAKKFPTEEHALAYFCKIRWPKGVICVSCSHDKCYLIETKGKTGKPARLFECAKCKTHFSATAGTLFHDSHLPLQKWFMAIALMSEAKKGVSAKQVQRHIGCAYKTAWYLCHRIRRAMQEPSDVKMGGEGVIVEIDETMIGGRVAGGHLQGQFNKTQVLGIVERGGKVHMQTLPNKSSRAIQQVVTAKLDPATETIVTDGSKSYLSVIPHHKHERGNHEEEKKKSRKMSNQAVEGAFSLFKRGVVGSYHKLGREHLDAYLGEFCWRYNRRGLQPWIFQMALMSMAENKPLPYKKLTEF